MKRSKAVLGLLAAGALVAAGCGSDSDSSSTTGGSATTAAAGAATTAAGGAATTAAGGAATTAAGGSSPTAASSGGSVPTAAPVKADSSMSPVLVGFHNIEGGAISLPEIRQGFESGINYVNEELGGINGHPVKIESCKTDVTPESSVNCANQFVEKNVVMAVQGVDVAADAALPIFKQAGLTEVALFPFSNGVDRAVGDAYTTLFSIEEGYAADMIQMKKQGTTTEAMLLADVPSAHALYGEVVEPTAKKVGIKVVPFYYPTQTDWTTFAATVLAANPDGVSWPAPQEGDTLAGVPALRSAGFTGPIHAGSTNQIYKDLDEKTLEGVIGHNEFYYANFTSVPPQAAADIAIYQRFIKRDFPDFKSTLYTQLGFHVAVTSMDMLRQVKGDVTPASVKAAMPTVKGHKFFTEGDYDCSHLTWPGTTACGSGLVFTKPVEDEKKEVLPEQPVDVSSVRPAG
jgi:branched-chain amino acid transport system substrate-binding protein